MGFLLELTSKLERSLLSVILHDSLVRPLYGVGESRVLRHVVLLEDERIRQVQRRELRGLHHDTRLPQRQTIHEQGVRWVCQRRQGDYGLVPRIQTALRLQRPGGNHHLLPHYGQHRRPRPQGMEGAGEGSVRQVVR